MVNSVVIICEDSPFGKNSAVESIRMATGLLAVGDLDDVKVVFMRDAIYFLNKNLNPQALNSDPVDTAGMEKSDLIQHGNLKVVGFEKISKLILEAKMSFKY